VVQPVPIARPDTLVSRVGRLTGSDPHLQTFCPDDSIEGGREVAASIVVQEAGLDLRLLELPGQAPRLLDGPATARVFAAGGEDDAPAGQLQEKQDVQALEENGVHREVVAGQDRLAVGT